MSSPPVRPSRKPVAAGRAGFTGDGGPLTVADRPLASLRDDAVTAFVGIWLTAGLFLDGWAHHNLSELETFFTPWHAVFYSGFASCALWLSWVVSRHVKAGRKGLQAIPIGYALGLLGVAIFAVGGLADMIWHTIYGIEQGLDALFSPSHLLLLAGGAAILTTPFRSAWGRSREEAAASNLANVVPALLSITLATAFVLFFLYYLWVFEYTFAFRPWEIYANARPSVVRDLGLGAGIASILLSNVLMTAPVLLLLRRFVPPFGAVTLFLGAIQSLMAAMLGPGDSEAFGAGRALIVLLTAGILSDALIAALRPYRDRLIPYRAFGALFPAVLWTTYFLLGNAWHGIAWSREMWTGMIVWNVWAGYMLAVITTLDGARPAARTEPQQSRQGA